MYEIEKNVSIADFDEARGRPRLYPFDQMEVGDCITVPSNKAQNARLSAYAYGKRHNMKFSCRTEKNGTKIKIFRVE